jgi:hypothetical protein
MPMSMLRLTPASEPRANRINMMGHLYIDIAAIAVKSSIIASRYLEQFGALRVASTDDGDSCPMADVVIAI